MGSIYRLENSVINYKPTPLNIPEKRRPLLHGGRSLKSATQRVIWYPQYIFFLPFSLSFVGSLVTTRVKHGYKLRTSSSLSGPQILLRTLLSNTQSPVFHTHTEQARGQICAWQVSTTVTAWGSVQWIKQDGKGWKSHTGKHKIPFATPYNRTRKTKNRRMASQVGPFKIN
jgi:hypothetical protein